jgi:aldehyde dehydrogenase (NAD+)
MLDKRRFFINGEWVRPSSQSDLLVLNPATEKPIAVISMGNAADIDTAVAAAKTAFSGYSRTTVEERLSLLERLLVIYKRRYHEMAAAITMELGAPATMSREQHADVGVGHLQGFIDALKRLKFRDELPSGDILLREPIGVCGLITPWNWPINQIALKVVPVLATGCTCVLKPSEFTPLNAMLYAEMIQEAGFPPGVFNLVNGDGINAGAELSKHRDIDMMSFTGSTRAGIAVSKDAADTVKRVTLELGGKSPNLIFEDADLEDRVTASVLECFNNSGQSCDAPSRMLVQRSVYERVVAIAEKTGKEVRVGNPEHEGDHIGPLVSAIQMARVRALIEAGVKEGARVLIGGPSRPDGFETGYFVRPTIFADVTTVCGSRARRSLDQFFA